MSVLDVNNYQVAVLLAAYNGEHYIIEQMESILAQDSVKVTIFMSVDQSSDSTLKIAKLKFFHMVRDLVLQEAIFLDY
jgi:glycosyltransferase involved in cell wall biosynthesis